MKDRLDRKNRQRRSDENPAWEAQPHWQMGHSDGVAPFIRSITAIDTV